MADYPSPGRLEIERFLGTAQERYDANAAQIAALQADNDRITIDIDYAQDTLAYIETLTMLADVTNFTLTSPAASPAADVDITWDDQGAGVSYNIQKARMADYSDASNVYNGPYTNILSDQDPSFVVGETIYYRIKSMKAGKDDSNWVSDSVVIM